MTMPHLMNCAHSQEGWCLDCVAKQWEELQELRVNANRYLWLRNPKSVEAFDTYTAAHFNFSPADMDKMIDEAMKAGD